MLPSRADFRFISRVPSELTANIEISRSTSPLRQDGQATGPLFGRTTVSNSWSQALQRYS